MSETAVALAGVAFGVFMGALGYTAGQHSVRPSDDFLTRVQVVTYLEDKEQTVEMKEVPVHMASGKIMDKPRFIGSWPQKPYEPSSGYPSPFRGRLVKSGHNIFLTGCTANANHCFGASDFRYANWAENKGFWPSDEDHKVDVNQVLKEENVQDS